MSVELMAASDNVTGADGTPSDKGRNAAAAGASTRLTHLQSIGEAVEESSDEASSTVGASSDDAGGAAAAARRGAARARGDPPPASPAPTQGRGRGRPPWAAVTFGGGGGLTEDMRAASTRLSTMPQPRGRTGSDFSTGSSSSGIDSEEEDEELRDPSFAFAA